MTTDGLNGYKCFYKGQSVDIHSDTTFHAQEAAATHFKTKKPWDISVFLCNHPDGQQVETSVSQLP